METTQAFTPEFYTAVMPEMLLFFGLLALMIIPNLGKGTFRIRGTQIRLPWFLGGQRYAWSSNPHLPAWIATLTLTGALELTQFTLSAVMLSLRRNCS